MRSRFRFIAGFLLLVGMSEAFAANTVQCAPDTLCVPPPKALPVIDSTMTPPYNPKVKAACGDGFCQTDSETSNSCPTDCGAAQPPQPYCGDGICNSPTSSLPRNENPENCAADCAGSCGDGFCTSAESRSNNCSADCGFPACAGGLVLRWSTSNGTCDGPTPTGVGSGQLTTINDLNGSVRGQADFRCFQGQWDTSPIANVSCEQFAAGSCAAAYNGQTVNDASNINPNGCATGTFSWIDQQGNDGTYNWICRGSGGAGDSACNANKQTAASGCAAGTANWGNGSCSSSYGQLNSGNSSQVTNQRSGFTGTAIVSCNGGTVAISNGSCQAVQQPVNGVCNAATEADRYTSPPTSNLCEPNQGTPTGVTDDGNGFYVWQCLGSNGGTTDSCRALKQQNGICGASNRGTFATAPSQDLCSAGNATPVETTSSQYIWSCTGTNGGATEQCFATKSFAGCEVHSALVDSTPSSTEGWRYHYDGGRVGGSPLAPPLSKGVPMSVEVRTSTEFFNSNYNATSNASSFNAKSKVVIPHTGTAIVTNNFRMQHSDYVGDDESFNLNQYGYQYTMVTCNNGAITNNPTSFNFSAKYKNCSDVQNGFSGTTQGQITGLSCDDTDDINNLASTPQNFKVWHSGGEKRTAAFQRLSVSAGDVGSCVVPPNTTRTWSTGSPNCSAGTDSRPRIVENGQDLMLNDQTGFEGDPCNPTGEFATGTAAFRCNNGQLSMTPNSGATCKIARPVCDGSNK